MFAVILILITALLFGIMSALLFKGRCSWLIAGYNTATKNERKMYDEKKLCKTASLITLLSALLLVIIACLGYLVESLIISENVMFLIIVVLVVIFLIIIFYLIWYMNERCTYL